MNQIKILLVFAVVGLVAVVVLATLAVAALIFWVPQHVRIV